MFMDVMYDDVAEHALTSVRAQTTMQNQGNGNKHKNMDETVILIP
jgi:hypothetical protein